MPINEKLRRVKPSLDELLPDPESREAFEEASAALEAGRLVRAFRQQRGITQRELADCLSITQARISAIETGEGRDGPSYALLKRIARACGASWPMAAAAKRAAAHATSAAKKRGGAGTSKTVIIIDTKGDIIGKVVGVSPGQIKADGPSGMKYDPDLGAFVIGKPGASVRRATVRRAQKLTMKR